MENRLDYRPKRLEFEFAHDGSPMPETFGEFKSAEDAMKFLGGNFVSINSAICVNRFMDHVEKKMLRDEYNDELENILPARERVVAEKQKIFSEAKQELADAQEMVSASLIKVKELAKEVKRGTRPINLDEQYTCRIPYKGKFYTYSYLDGELRLVSILDIPSHQRDELFSGSSTNEQFIEDNFSSTKEIEQPDEKSDSKQKGKKK